MILDDVRYNRDLPESEDDAPEGEPEHARRPPPAQPEFALDDIEF